MLLLAAAPAHAQFNYVDRTDDYSRELFLKDQKERERQAAEAKARANELQVRVGGGALYLPKFEGSDSYRTLPLPYFDINWKNRVLVSPAKGLEFNMFDAGNFQFGPSANIRFGRDTDDADYLRGLEDIDIGLKAGIYGRYEYVISPANKIDLLWNFLHDVTDNGETGWTSDIELSYKRAITKHLFVINTIGTTYASEEFMQTYFGVTPVQSLQSGLPTAILDDGFKNVLFRSNVIYMFNDMYSLTGFFTYSRLIDQTENSPIVQLGSNDQFFGGLFFVVSF